MSKTLSRFNIKTEYLELINIEAEKRSISKHEYLNFVLYEYMIKQHNRLSNHVVRDVENLVLMLLISDKKYKNIEEVLKQACFIDAKKRTILHEQKYSNKDKTFWNKLLAELNPSEFKILKTQEDANNKITALYNIVKEHMEVFQ